ncbi:MAG: 16S rRNA (cytosine(1402)-N(4))-methyltransferase RsmH [Patescibacteria group bacterium]|nr:16S rRNA (cytosine(1402)-N(4))-methyltransferase RsmH [Patescibacteria group bacterium]
MSQEKATVHKAVMVSEAMEALQPRAGGRYLDATLGGGTHSMELLKLSAPDGCVLSLDVDPTALSRAEQQNVYGKRWQIVESNFSHLKEVAEKSGWMPFDGILFDLGLSSDELADPSKGLSFQIDGPLDMRLGPKANDDGLTAATIVNSWSEHELTEFIRAYGEEKFAARIARAIIERRRQKPIVSTLDLANLIKASVPNLHAAIHPATRTFQALRIAVNDELAVLKSALDQADEILAPNGTIAVISFHSLEDRIVKQAFKKFVGYQITKKPIRPNSAETKTNPRARSAKLRAAHKNATKQTNLCHGRTRLL